MELNYKKYGDSGKVLLIIHGIFGSLDNWHTVAKELSEHYQIYTLDMRNHGHSPHHPEMSIKIMAQDVFNFCTAHQLQNINLVGHSMGGKVAMQFANEYQSSLEKLVVVDIAPKSYKAGHYPYFKAYEEIDLNKITNRKELDQVFSEYEPNFGVRQFLMKNIVSNGEGGYHLKINLEGIKNGYQNIIDGLSLNKVEAPTQFIYGEKSNYITIEDQEIMKSIFSNVQFDMVANSGHWVHAENKDEFIAKLIQFIS